MDKLSTQSQINLVYLPETREGYDRSWTEPTPCAYGTAEDSTLILEHAVICSRCGGCAATQRMSYVWAGTTDPRLVALGMGASVKHYFTDCPQCGCAVS